jgi:hypothetical protein
MINDPNEATELPEDGVEQTSNAGVIVSIAVNQPDSESEDDGAE